MSSAMKVFATRTSSLAVIVALKARFSNTVLVVHTYTHVLNVTVCSSMALYTS